jgi:membrane protease YdiL (CAAX protease family)
MRHARRMTEPGWRWHTPPGWPEPPEGWKPGPGWQPAREWPQPPPGWQFWVRAARERTKILVQPLTRRGLVLETWFVEIAFLATGVLGAVDLLAQHIGGVASVTRFQQIVPNHPLENFFLGMINYLQVGVMVPLALLLLSRTGQRPEELGLVRPRWKRDLWPGAGLALGGLGISWAFSILFIPLEHSSLFNSVPTGRVPDYYIIYGLLISATTAITEETLVSGYLLTRLDQLGWDPRWAFALSLTLRTSYHVYYGLGFLLTIPTGYLFTRSFQKHRRLARPILAHFLYDSVLFIISILVA